MRDRRLLAMANFYLDTGRPREAIDQLKRLLGEEPEQAEAHALLAMALLDDKRRYAAEVEARIAVGLNPESDYALRALALVELELDHPDKAEEALEVLRATSPDQMATWMVSSHACRRRGDKAGAWRHLERALALAPNDPEVLAGASGHHLWSNDLGLARRFALEAMGAAPHSDAAREAMAWVHLRAGEVEEAEQLTVSLLRDHPGSREALSLIASIKARKNPILGLWWRWNVRMVAMGNQVIVVLLGAFVFYRLARLAIEDVGLTQFVEPVEILWLGLCAYTWFAPTIFNRMLDRELRQIQLGEDF